MSDFRKRINHPLMPSDATPEEYIFLTRSVISLYEQLPEAIDKFLIAFVYELGYTQDMAAEAIGKSPGWVSQRVAVIKKSLAKNYRIRIDDSKIKKYESFDKST